MKWSVGLEAEGDRDDAIEKGTAVFVAAARRAGLPQYPIVRTTVVSEDEDADL